MRRLYVVEFADWFEELRHVVHPTIGSHGIHLIDYATQENAELLTLSPRDWEQLPEVIEWRASGSQMLMSTSLAHSEAAEDKWHGHPRVAVLPHPVHFGNRKIATRPPGLPQVGRINPLDVLDPERKIKGKHIEGLGKCRVRSKNVGLGFDEQTDTVLTLADKAAKVDPLLKLRAVL